MEIVKYLIPKYGNEQFELDSDGNTYLHWAAQEGHQEVLKYLVEECGFDLNVENQVGYFVNVHVLYIFSLEWYKLCIR